MNKASLLFLIQFCTIFLLIIKGLAQECFKDNSELNCKLGSKTPYRFIANHNETRPIFPGCVEKKIWMMVRHGTRYPKEKIIKSMKKNLKELKKQIIKNYENKNLSLSEDIINNLKNWTISIDKHDAMDLTDEGKNELMELAERMQERFPSIFVKDYDKKLFKFKYTDTQRTKKSAEYFTLGLFGQSQRRRIKFPTPEDKDPILRFYKRCQRWNEFKKNSSAYKERDLFLQGDIIKTVLLNISARVGVKNLDYDLASLIYTTCAFETAWTSNKKSPWCDILTLDEVKVLEFVEDLKLYGVDGYGHNLNYEQACPAFKDLFSFLESTDESLATVYFTHSGTILKMLSRLGIAKDEKPLTHESFSLNNSRKWKASLIDTFASNIAVVLYDCDKSGPSVLVLHQERVAHLPGCPNEGLCPMSVMKNIFPDNEEECPFEDMCRF